LLLTILPLLVTGCSVVQSLSRDKPTPTPSVTTEASTNAPQPIASTVAQPENPGKPVQTDPQIAQLVAEVKAMPRPAPATATKGAEKLTSANTVAPAHSNEKNSKPGDPPGSKVHKSDEGVAVAPARPAVTELIFKGPPRQVKKRRSFGNGFIWFGGLLCAGASALGVRIYQVHAGKPRRISKADKDGLVTPEGFDLKELKNPGPEPVIVDKS